MDGKRCGIKMNEIMPSVATQKGLNMILLGEVSQKEKGKYCIVSLTCGI